jgi:hypothetical protein
MEERRAFRRTNVLRNAKIILGHRSPIVSCTLKDLTSHGACLSVASTYGLPDLFELTFEHGRSRRVCRVMWRTHDKLGVSFDPEMEQAAAAEEPQPAAEKEG